MGGEFSYLFLAHCEPVSFPFFPFPFIFVFFALLLGNALTSFLYDTLSLNYPNFRSEITGFSIFSHLGWKRSFLGYCVVMFLSFLFIGPNPKITTEVRCGNMKARHCYVSLNFDENIRSFDPYAKLREFRQQDDNETYNGKRGMPVPPESATDSSLCLGRKLPPQGEKK